MSLNIFQIWDSIGRKTPFAVRRDTWSADYYTIVERIECETLPYGKAFGNPTINGKYSNHYEYDKKWRNEKIIPCCGCYQWTLVENADFSKYESGIAATVKTAKGAYTINSQFYFGKYKGLNVADVFEKDPKYIEWVINNLDAFYLTKETIDYLEKANTNFQFDELTHKMNAQKLLSGANK